MRDLLFLSHRIPYPPNKGDKIRAWHILDHLAARFRIHLGCFVDDESDWAYVPKLRDRFETLQCLPLHKRRQRLRSLLRVRPGRPLTLDYFHDPRMVRWVDETRARRQLAATFVFSSGMAGYVMHPGREPRVLDMVDVDSEKFTEYASRSSLLAQLVWRREGRTLLAFERRAAASFDRTLLVSREECERFEALAPETRGRVDWMENGVDLDYFAPAEIAMPDEMRSTSDRPSIVFTGTMDYWPNVDAVCWFVREVMPLLDIQSRQPRFFIVGANPTPEVAALASADVAVTGRVADVRGYIANAAVVVAPLRIARGIQNKVLEAMAMARPVVATRQAFEGVRAQPGRDLLVADDAITTAHTIDDVLAGRYPDIGGAARQTMETGYNWIASLGRLDRLIDELTGPRNDQ